MAKAKELNVRAYILTGGEYRLWYEIDEDKNVKWRIPENIKERQMILDNIGRAVSDYYSKALNEYTRNNASP